MLAVIQVTDGVKLSIDNNIYNETKNKTLLVLLGVKDDDQKTDADYIIKKLPKLRVFNDEDGKINLSAHDINASIFIVSQFTLYGKTKKCNRPSFTESAPYEKGKEYYEYVVDELNKTGLDIKTGKFGSMMNLEFNNNGPITIIMDSRE